MRNHIVAVALIGAVLFTGCSGNNARKEQTPSSSPSISATASTSTFASPTASITPSPTPTPTTSPTISEVTPEPAATADAEQHRMLSRYLLMKPLLLPLSPRQLNNLLRFNSNRIPCSSNLLHPCLRRLRRSSGILPRFQNSLRL